jgi:hypothetical protein
VLGVQSFALPHLEILDINGGQAIGTCIEAPQGRKKTDGKRQDSLSSLTGLVSFVPGSPALKQLGYSLPPYRADEDRTPPVFGASPAGAPPGCPLRCGSGKGRIENRGSPVLSCLSRSLAFCMGRYYCSESTGDNIFSPNSYESASIESEVSGINLSGAAGGFITEGNEGGEEGVLAKC